MCHLVAKPIQDHKLDLIFELDAVSNNKLTKRNRTIVFVLTQTIRTHFLLQGWNQVVCVVRSAAMKRRRIAVPLVIGRVPHPNGRGSGRSVSNQQKNPVGAQSPALACTTTVTPADTCLPWWTRLIGIATHAITGNAFRGLASQDLRAPLIFTTGDCLIAVSLWRRRPCKKQRIRQKSRPTSDKRDRTVSSGNNHCRKQFNAPAMVSSLTVLSTTAEKPLNQKLPIIPAAREVSVKKLGWPLVTSTKMLQHLWRHAGLVTSTMTMLP